MQNPHAGRQTASKLCAAFLAAVVRGQRVVFVLENEDSAEEVWVHDCRERLHWFCYFAAPCNDSVVRRRDLLGKTVSRYDSHVARSGFRQFISGDQKALKATFPEIFRTCLGGASPLGVTAIAAQFLWRYSPAVAEWMSTKVSLLRNAYGGRYAALQWRLTDKAFEYGPTTARLIRNTSYVAATVYEAMSTRNLSVLFVATDDCAAFRRLGQLLRSRYASSLRIFSTCSARHEGLVARGGFENARDALLDVELLRQGEVLIGSVYSNMIRMVYRLRYPRLRYVNLADEYCVLDKSLMTDAGVCWGRERDEPEERGSRGC